MPMKTLLTILAISITTTVSAQFIIEFSEDVIVFEPYIKKGKERHIEKYAGSGMEVGPFIAHVKGPVKLRVVTISDDQDHYIDFPEPIDRGTIILHKWRRGDYRVTMDEKTGIVIWHRLE
jgi:hypothetical protein